LRVLWQKVVNRSRRRGVGRSGLSTSGKNGYGQQECKIICNFHAGNLPDAPGFINLSALTAIHRQKIASHQQRDVAKPDTV
jgi:hypothetical protein